MTNIYDLNSYDYMLPRERIATHPVSPRDAAKLLVWEQGRAEHKIFADLADYLHEGDVLVVNNSRVIPARLHGVRPSRGGDAPPVNVEILLHRPLGDFSTWRVFARPAKRLRESDLVQFADGVTAEITGRAEEQVTLRFNLAPDAVSDFLHSHGEVPLPPYIERAADTSDAREYQTVYADDNAPGSVAAPTAGLHFTDELLTKLRAKNVTIAEVTLHVGAGTFLSVMTSDIRQHKMHAEWGEVSAATAAIIARAKETGGKIIAVGTTATRLLETAARDTGRITAWSGETDIFITPGFEFCVVDGLVTNFHLPKSTLLMLVSAFMGGVEEMQALYAAAIANAYRFYSYGDACLLTRP
ncbi:MAG: S-adenosylmethionine:tRNA ribosyltransferase-isomerase [Alphaproteobacteria bacterium]|nr:S-adenosylmethionine:tRNA ribosyltransferase-isomerase [Alphaproteobacteria bacterium]